jgi:hypothetical protein
LVYLPKALKWFFEVVLSTSFWTSIYSLLFNIFSRGSIAGLGPFFVSSGITFVYSLGAFLPWRWVCLICAALPFAAALVMPFLPETPNWLVHNGKIAQAEKVS